MFDNFPQGLIRAWEDPTTQNTVEILAIPFTVGLVMMILMLFYYIHQPRPH